MEEREKNMLKLMHYFLHYKNDAPPQMQSTNDSHQAERVKKSLAGA